MSTVPAAPRRHALGMPAGSVRALLAFGVLGLSWALALRTEFGGQPATEHKLPLPFVYLQTLMVLIIAHFFAAHGSTIGPAVSKRSPLGLPRGSVRFLLLIGYVGLGAFLFRTEPDFEYPAKAAYILLLLLLISGFFLGHLLSGLMRILGGGQSPAWYQDFEAWIALLAMIGLAVLVIVHVFINPSVSEEYKLDMPTLEAGLAGLVGFYFGARS